jgi:hypothetical protein
MDFLHASRSMLVMKLALAPHCPCQILLGEVEITLQEVFP